MKSATKIFLVILIALPVFPATAQRIKATASLDSAHILLGDQVKLYLEIDHPKNVHVEFPEVPDTLLDRVEVLERSGIDIFRMDDEDFQ
ncbi:MAG: hypothetical protein PHV35_11760 [Mariniphaga sp.]|nr:hypothetical protein [Mariniphaga sp.]